MMLDEPERMAELDPTGMTGLIERYPEQVAEALQLPLPDLSALDGATIKKVLFLGMGGSGAGGELAVQLLDEAGTAVGRVVHDYDAPTWVDGETLIIATSFSGGTEETLAALATCREQAAGWVAIASGGALLKSAERDGAPFVRVPSGPHPRAAYGYLTVPVLRLLAKLGLLDERQVEESLRSAVDVCRQVQRTNGTHVHKDDNPTKQLVEHLSGRQVLLVADTPYAAVAERIRCQINENGKTVAFTRILPEANHNDTVAWAAGPRYTDWACLWVGPFNRNPALRARATFVRGLLEQRGMPVFDLDVTVGDPLAHRLALIYLGDWVSLYLAFQNGEDPGDVSVIPQLKEEAAGTGLIRDIKRRLGIS